MTPRKVLPWVEVVSKSVLPFPARTKESLAVRRSGGARVITYVQVVGETVFLLAIYDKSAKSSLDEGELDALLSEIDE